MKVLRAITSAGVVAFVIVACGGRLAPTPCDDCPGDALPMPPVFDARPPSFDAKPPPPPPIDAPSPGMCPTPLDVSSFKPTPVVFPHPITNACTSQQVQGFYDNCYGPNSSAQKCMMYRMANMACVSCVESARTDSQWGAVVLGNGLVSLDIAGCVYLLGDPVCTKAIEYRDQCIWAACDMQCPIVDGPSFQDWMKCSMVATAGGCKSWADAANTTCSMNGALAACSKWQDFGSGFVQYGTMFCAGGG